MSCQVIEKIESAHPSGHVDARSQPTNANGLIVSSTPHLFDKRETELFNRLKVLDSLAHQFRVGQGSKQKVDSLLLAQFGVAPIDLLYAPSLRHVTSCCINRFQSPSHIGMPL